MSILARMQNELSKIIVNKLKLISILCIDIHVFFPLSEGSPCNMHDGGRGMCKNIEHCVSLKQALRHGQLRLQNIVGCSFVVNKIICNNFNTQCLFSLFC